MLARARQKIPAPSAFSLGGFTFSRGCEPGLTGHSHICHPCPPRDMAGNVWRYFQLPKLMEKGTCVSIMSGVAAKYRTTHRMASCNKQFLAPMLAELPWRKPKTNKNFHSKPSFLRNKTTSIRTLAESRTSYPTKQRKVNLLKSLKESHNVIYDQFH